MLEYKDLTGSVKDIDVKGRIITGYLSNFGNKDFDGDIIEEGAFSKSINERKEQIFFLNQHNWKQPHGKFNVLKEDNKGLYFESNPLIDTTYSSDVLKLYAAGVIKEHSIGFNVIKSDGKNGDRSIKEIKLYEGSNVTLGANPDTPFTGFKSTLKEIEDKTSAIYKAIRNGEFTDETFILLEYALKQLQQEAYQLGKSLDEPSIQDTNEPIIETIKLFTNELKLS